LVALPRKSLDGKQKGRGQVPTAKAQQSEIKKAVGSEAPTALNAQKRFLSTRHQAHSDKAKPPRYRLELGRGKNG